MEEYIIRKALDSNCNFIKHYVKLSEKYNNPDDITKDALSTLKK